jgi:hypothetical protein
MRRKIADLRSRLSSALRDQFSREIARGSDRIREGIGPYSRFVRSEGEKLRAMEGELREIRGALVALRARIEKQEALPVD